MERIVERCCGLDVGQKTVAACVRVTAPNGGRQQIIRTFSTMTEDLLALRDWLAAHEGHTWQWNPRVCTGKPCTTSWRTPSRCCWLMRNT